MDKQKKFNYVAALLVSIAMVTTPVFAFESPIPKNITHFKLEQTNSFDVYNGVSRPGISSSFDISVSNDGKQWTFDWNAPIQKNNVYKMHSHGVWTVKSLKNGSFELDGNALTITEKNATKKIVEKFKHYHKVFYPIQNLKGNYNYIAHMTGENENIDTAGQAHFIIPNQ